MSQSNNTLYGDLITGLKEAIAHAKGEKDLKTTTIKTCDYIDYDRHICVVDIDCLECDVHKSYMKRREMNGR